MVYADALSDNLLRGFGAGVGDWGERMTITAITCFVVAGLVASTGLVKEYFGPFWKRIKLRSPIYVLPRHLTAVSTADKLGVEFVRVQSCYDDLKMAQEYLKEMLDRQERTERKIKSGARFPLFWSPPRHSDRAELQDKYDEAKRHVWRALVEFREIFSRSV
jgi:hypothetical protein